MHDLREEAKRYDPDGNYVRKWLPALARMPSKYIHCPHEVPSHAFSALPSRKPLPSACFAPLLIVPVYRDGW